jgi:hypothetical protein
MILMFATVGLGCLAGTYAYVPVRIIRPYMLDFSDIPLRMNTHRPPTV